jgi:nucleotidyltransferase/DNA polymerase involved in DNA repair
VPPTDINERRRSKERALEFARSCNGDGFTAADLAHAWGIENAQVTFPVLNALARDGQLVRIGSKPTRFQVVAAA